MADDATPTWQQLTEQTAGLTRMGRLDEAIETGKQALDSVAELLTTDAEHARGNQAIVQKVVAGAYYAKQDATAARELMTEAIDNATAEFGREVPFVAELLHELGVIEHGAERHEQAEAAYTESLAIREKVLGENHALVAKTLSDVARLAGDLDKDPSEIEPKLDRVRTILAATIADEEVSDADKQAVRLDLAISLNNLGNFYLAQQRPADAEGVLRESFDVVTKYHDLEGAPNPPFLEAVLGNLHAAFEQQEKPIGEGSEFQTEFLAKAQAIVDKASGGGAEGGGAGEPQSVEEALQREQEFWTALGSQLNSVAEMKSLTDADLAGKLRDMLNTQQFDDTFKATAEAHAAVHGFLQRVFEPRLQLIQILPAEIEQVIQGEQTLATAIEHIGHFCLAQMQAIIDQQLAREGEAGGEGSAS